MNPAGSDGGINLFACTINTDSRSSNLLLDQLTATYLSHAIGVNPDAQDPWGAQFHPHTTGLSGVHDLYLFLLDPPAGGELDGFTFR